MRTTTTVLLICLTTAFSWQAPRWQDPRPARPQDPKPASKQAEQGKPEGSEREPAAKEKQIPGKPKRHRFEGVYKLKRRFINGVRDEKPSKGYLAITGRHLLLHLASDGPNKRYKLVHSGVREWREMPKGIETTARLETYTDDGGKLHFVKDGARELRRIEPIHGGLRVMQGLRTWLEFERIE